MRKVLKIIGIILAGLVGLILVAVLVVFVITTSRRGRTYDVSVSAVTIQTDEATVARGEHIVKALAGCDGCHGENLGGMVLLEDPAILNLYGPNLTNGEGGAGSRFSTVDWVRAIRHGVNPEGKPLLLMPAQNFNWMTDEDLGALIAYIQSLPPVDNELPDQGIGPMGLLLALTEPGMFPAELIEHSTPPTEAIEPGVTVEYGGYLVAIGTCRDCHGEHLNGRPLPPMLDEPPARNLTPAGQLANWTEADFIQTARTGVTPGGYTLQEPMAGVLKSLRQQTDEELRAIFLYLQSLPPREFGE